MADQRQIERPTLYERVIIDDQVLSSMLAKALHITKAELALALGLPAETLRKREREQSRPTQRRMRGLVEILNPCQPLDRFGSASLCLVSKRAAAAVWRTDGLGSGGRGPRGRSQDPSIARRRGWLCIVLPLFRYQGLVYRAHEPQWAFDPASGQGAALYGGRFNKPGSAALYTATSIMGAITEAAQGMMMRLPPLTIVSYQVDHDAVLDLATPAACNAAGIQWDAGLPNNNHAP